MLRQVSLGVWVVLTLAMGSVGRGETVSGYVNVGDFVTATKGTDDTEAVRAAFAEAGRLKCGVLFPAGRYRISETITVKVREIVGQGYPEIIQSDENKDVFYNAGAWRITIRGLVFKGGRDQIVLGNNNTDQGFLVISDCRFWDASGAAVRFLEGTNSSFCLVEKCAFRNCVQTLISVCDQGHLRDCWISTTRRRSNKAAIENYGVLTCVNIIGVPRVTSTDQRWIDNYGTLSCRKFRFGGEGAGFTPIVNYAKVSPKLHGKRIVVEDCFVAALGNNKRACAIYCEEIPNYIAVRDSCISGVPIVIVDKKIDLKTYFDGVRPGMVGYNVSENYGEFTGQLPTALIQAASNRTVGSVDYGEAQLDESATAKALSAAVEAAGKVPSASAGEMNGHAQKTDPDQYVDLTGATYVWSVDDNLDATSEKVSAYLAVARAGDDVVILNRIDEGSFPHVRVRDVTVDLDKTPWLTWRLKDNGIAGGHQAVKVIDNATGAMAKLMENYTPDQFGYYAYDLRKVFGVDGGERSIDIKFYFCGARTTGPRTVVKVKRGDYFVLDFMRLETD